MAINLNTNSLTWVMTELVIGGFGFIGSNLVRELVKNGKQVAVLDNEFLGKKENLDGVECAKIKGDVLDLKLLEKIISEHGIKHIYYFGGYSSAPMFEKTPLRVADCFQMFINVLECARKNRIKVIYASTSSLYSRCKKPFREDMTIVPGTPYELSKYAMEQAAHMYSLYYNVTANGARFFSVYGPHEKYKGRFANNLTQFFWSIKNNVSPIVYGDGTQSRDFTFVKDLVKAVIMIMEKGKGSEVYNIGTGKEVNFNKMVEIINKTLKKNVKPFYMENPLKNYVMETQADISKIKKEIGWAPETSLEEGIKYLSESDDSISFEEVMKLYEHLGLKWDSKKNIWT